MYTDKLSSILGHSVRIAPVPVTLRYGIQGLRREAGKAALGVVLCLVTLTTLSPTPVIAWPVAAAGLLFGVYLAEQWRRSRLRYRVDGVAIERASRGISKRIEWSRLEGLQLHFYPHRRRSLQGTLVLRLRGAGTRIKVDSALEEFPTLLLHAAGAARERGLETDPTTAANLRQLGL